jgi:hypothetical protein
VNPENVKDYIKDRCFAAPAGAIYNGAHYMPLGNAERNELSGPGQMGLYFSLVKDTFVHRTTGTFNVQFRAEAFDIVNHPKFVSLVDNSHKYNQFAKWRDWVSSNGPVRPCRHTRTAHINQQNFTPDAVCLEGYLVASQRPA